MPDAARSSARLRSRLALIVLPVLGGVCITAATWSAFRYGVEREGPGLPVLGTVPAFSLISSTGQPFSQAELSGQIWVADFIFTQCPGVCPVLSAQMARLQSTVQGPASDAVRLVSFSVDPVHDTPAVLHDYGERFHADGSRWLFVTGERDALYSLIGQGFHLAVADRPPDQNADGTGLITHSDRFVLIDRTLQIRGYYHGTDPDSVSHLLTDITTLRNAS